MNVIEEKLINAISSVIIKKYDLELTQGLVMLELPKDKSHGQYTTNISMRLSKQLNKNPKEIANEIIDDIKNQVNEIDKIEVAGPGFINFFIKSDKLSSIINRIININDKYDYNNIGNNEKILIEYVSANPTGSLHLGLARGAVWGDVCAKLMKISGYDVLREYYINDALSQINNLALSIDARYKELFDIKIEFPIDGYHADDVIEIAKYVKDIDGHKWLYENDNNSLNYFKKIGMKYELNKIKKRFNKFSL